MAAAALAVSALICAGPSAAARAARDKPITVVVNAPPTAPKPADPLSIVGGTDARTVPLRAANAAL